MKCSLCEDESEEESECHLLRCPKIVAEIKDPRNITNATYEDIFSDNIDTQVNITKIFNEVLKVRKVLIHNKKN